MGRMTCNECRRWWSPYLDSELDATKTFEVSEHLRVCGPCRERFEREKRVDDALREKLCEERMPADVWSGLCSRVRQPTPLVRMPWLRPLAIAASLVLIVTAGSLVYRQMTSTADRAKDVTITNVTPNVAMASLLRDASPQLAAFTGEEKGFAERVADLDLLSRDLLGASISIDVAGLERYHLEFVDVRKRTDNSGTDYIEVRLNCCNYPVLLAFSERGHEHVIAEFREVCNRCPSQGCPPPVKDGGIETRTIERNGVIVAGATNDPHLGEILAAIQIDRV